LTWAPDYADTAAGLELSRAMAETRLNINYQANKGIRFTDDDLIRWATAMTCPVLILHGEADPRSAACAVALADHITDVSVRIIQGAGHLPWIERPDETTAALRDLIAAGQHPRSAP
jgi:proline iminopeptidase